MALQTKNGVGNVILQRQNNGVATPFFLLNAILQRSTPFLQRQIMALENGVVKFSNAIFWEILQRHSVSNAINWEILQRHSVFIRYLC